MYNAIQLLCDNKSQTNNKKQGFSHLETLSVKENTKGLEEPFFSREARQQEKLKGRGHMEHPWEGQTE